VVGVVSYLICRLLILKNIGLIADAIVNVQEKGDLTVVTRINSNDALGKQNTSFNKLLERF
jgi:methyl-accepting chemotaxis protein